MKISIKLCNFSDRLFVSSHGGDVQRVADVEGGGLATVGWGQQRGGRGWGQQWGVNSGGVFNL